MGAAVPQCRMPYFRGDNHMFCSAACSASPACFANG